MIAEANCCNFPFYIVKRGKYVPSIVGPVCKLEHIGNGWEEKYRFGCLVEIV